METRGSRSTRLTEWKWMQGRLPESKRTRSAAPALASEPISPGSSWLSPRGIGVDEGAERPYAGHESANPAVTSRKSHEEARFEQSGVSPWIAIATRRIQDPARIDCLSRPVTFALPSRSRNASRILPGPGVLSPHSAIWRGQLARNPGAFSLMIVNVPRPGPRPPRAHRDRSRPIEPARQRWRPHFVCNCLHNPGLTSLARNELTSARFLARVNEFVDFGNQPD